MLRSEFRFCLAALLLTLSACSSAGHISADHDPAHAIPQGPLTPRSLLGVAPHALSARLGEPDFKRSEPIGAEIWQYGGGACNLFIYFYPNKAGALDSTHVDARHAEGGSVSAHSCLEMVEKRRSPPA